jgi:LuxR family transcriptional regulator
MDLQVVAAGPDAAALRSDPVWTRLDTFARTYGFDHWTYTASPISKPDDDCGVTITTYPEAHTREFFRRRLDRTNPGQIYARWHDRSTTYAAVRAGASPPTPAVSAQLALNRRHDVNRGVVIPLHGEIGTIASLSLVFRGTEVELESCFSQMTRALSDFGLDLHREIQEAHVEAFLRNRVPRLTDRQREIIRRFAEGDSSADVAGRLRISIHTVDKHVALIKARLGARSLAHATGLAMKWRLLG